MSFEVLKSARCIAVCHNIAIDFELLCKKQQTFNFFFTAVQMS